MKAIRIAFLAAAAATCLLGISQAQAQQQLPAAWCVIKREFLDTQGTWIKEYAVARREDMAWMGPWDMLDCNLTFTDAFKKRDALAGTGSSGGAAPPVVAAAPPVAPLPPVAVGPTVPSTPAVQSPDYNPSGQASRQDTNKCVAEWNEWVRLHNQRMAEQTDKRQEEARMQLEAAEVARKAAEAAYRNASEQTSTAVLLDLPRPSPAELQRLLKVAIDAKAKSNEGRIRHNAIYNQNIKQREQEYVAERAYDRCLHRLGFSAYSQDPDGFDRLVPPDKVRPLTDEEIQKDTDDLEREARERQRQREANSQPSSTPTTNTGNDTPQRPADNTPRQPSTSSSGTTTSQRDPPADRNKLIDILVGRIGVGQEQPPAPPDDRQRIANAPPMTPPNPVTPLPPPNINQPRPPIGGTERSRCDEIRGAPGSHVCNASLGHFSEKDRVCYLNGSRASIPCDAVICPPDTPHTSTAGCQEMRCTEVGRPGADGKRNFDCRVASGTQQASTRQPPAPAPLPPVTNLQPSPAAVTPLPPITRLGAAVIPVAPPVSNSAPPLVATPAPAPTPLGPPHVNVYEPPVTPLGTPHVNVYEPPKTPPGPGTEPHSTGCSVPGARASSPTGTYNLKMTASVNRPCKHSGYTASGSAAPIRSVEISSGAKLGTVTANGNGWTYVATKAGTDRFTVKIRNNKGVWTNVYQVTVQ
jgi:hypothetical protein